jgi:hypothetical protein
VAAWKLDIPCIVPRGVDSLHALAVGRSASASRDARSGFPARQALYRAELRCASTRFSSSVRRNRDN